MITMLTCLIHMILTIFINRLDFPIWLEWFDEFHEKVCDFWLGLID